MKNLLLIVAFVSGCITLSTAQNFSVGPTVGANYSWLSEAGDDATGLLGLNAGVTMVYSTELHWGLGADIKYSGEGNRFEIGDQNFDTRLHYIRVPLKFYGFMNDFEDAFRPKVYVGPSFGFLVDATAEGSEIDIKDALETFDVGATVGLGFNYRLASRTWLNFDVAYTHGLTNISKIENSTTTSNRNLNVNLGVAFGF